MIRSKHMLTAACGFVILAAVCLGMLAFQCNNCILHTLNVIATGLMTAAVLVGGILAVAAIWSTQQIWHACRLHVVSHPQPLQRVCQRLGIPENQILCCDRSEEFVFCVGWLRPKVVVSTGLLEQVTARELTAILAHERCHQHRRDPLRLLAMRIIRMMLYPLPAIQDIYHSFQALLEIEADQAAMSVSDRTALAGAMYKMLSRPEQPRVGSLPGVFTPFSASHTRLEHLLDPHHTIQLPLSTPRLAISLFPFLILCLSMFSA